MGQRNYKELADRYGAENAILYKDIDDMADKELEQVRMSELERMEDAGKAAVDRWGAENAKYLREVKASNKYSKFELSEPDYKVIIDRAKLIFDKLCMTIEDNVKAMDTNKFKPEINQIAREETYKMIMDFLKEKYPEYSTDKE
jgi:hypothetical protein